MGNMSVSAITSHDLTSNKNVYAKLKQTGKHLPNIKLEWNWGFIPINLRMYRLKKLKWNYNKN